VVTIAINAKAVPVQTFSSCRPRIIVEATVKRSDINRTVADLDRNLFFLDRAYSFPRSILDKRSWASSSGVSPGNGTSDWIG
jgi:hypothetical protein